MSILADEREFGTRLGGKPKTYRLDVRLSAIHGGKLRARFDADNEFAMSGFEATPHVAKVGGHGGCLHQRADLRSEAASGKLGGSRTCWWWSRLEIVASDRRSNSYP